MPSCKACHSKTVSAWKDKNKERHAEMVKDWARRNKERKREHSDKWKRNNVDQQIAYRKERYASDPEKYKDISRKWKSDNKEKTREYKSRYAKSNPDKAKHWRRNASKTLAAERRKRWAERNPEYVPFLLSRKRAAKKMATPKWANSFFIIEAYRLAKDRELATNIKWHVDHIAPLAGKIVCGLHLESNLQVISMSINQKKSASFSSIDDGVVSWSSLFR